MKKYLNLRLNRVDLVDRGANPGAHITLAKRATTEGRRMAEIPMDTSEVAKRLAEVETERVELTKRVEKAESEAKVNAETVAKMLEDAAKSEAVSIAKGLDKVPGKAEDVANLLFVAKRKFEASEYEAFVTVLKAANEQIAKGKLFAAIGGDAVESEASDLDRLVNKLSIEKGIPRHTALSEVMTTPEGKAAYSAVAGRN